MASILLLIVLFAPAVLAQNSISNQLGQSQFTGFLKLMETVDLIPELEAAARSGDGLTIFAPTDDALLYKTSPTLLAFLKHKDNRDALRRVLLSHIVVERLSPFEWTGTHRTLEGSPMKLSMDSEAFYAHDVAVTRYNALVTGDVAVHALATLIMPSDMAASTRSFVEEVTQVRRVLVVPHHLAAAPEGAMSHTRPHFQKPTDTATLTPPENKPLAAVPASAGTTSTPSAAGASAGVSTLTLVAALATALLL